MKSGRESMFVEEVILTVSKVSDELKLIRVKLMILVTYYWLDLDSLWVCFVLMSEIWFWWETLIEQLMADVDVRSWNKIILTACSGLWEAFTASN